MMTNIEKMRISNYNLWYILTTTINMTSPLSSVLYETKYFSCVLIKSWDSWGRIPKQTKLMFFFFLSKESIAEFLGVKSCQNWTQHYWNAVNLCWYIYYYFLLSLNPREKDSWKKYRLNPKWCGNKEIRDIQTCKGETVKDT